MKIKFSHIYPKVLSGIKPKPVTRAMLLDVHNVELSELSKRFLEYDATAISGEVFPLPKRGKYLMLIFKKPQILHELNLFTTLRRWTPEKERYYKSLIGKTLDVEYVSPPENKGN